MGKNGAMLPTQRLSDEERERAVAQLRRECAARRISQPALPILAILGDISIRGAA
jgi:hypothetical protein